jgi:hypothetical protein
MRSAIFQAALVVLGVVLAFSVNEWREARAARHDALRALDAIMEELKANREAVASSFEYHQGRLEIIGAAMREGAPLRIEQFERGFVMPAQLSRSAWDAASEIGAFNNLPYERVLALGKVYARQDAYHDQLQSVSAIVYREIFDKGPTGVLDNPRGLVSLVGAFLYREQQLLDAYEKTLTETARR